MSSNSEVVPRAIVVYERPPSGVSRTQVRAWAERLGGSVAKGRVFTCMVAPAESLRRLNLDFRGKDESTDVLSFPSSLPASAPSGHQGGNLGDLAISLHHARQQARERGHSVEDEIAVLMLHGLLHLMGMDHETDRGQMRRLEAKWRRELGLPLSLTERAQLQSRKPQR